MNEEGTMEELLRDTGPLRPSEAVAVAAERLGITTQEARDGLWQALDLGRIVFTRDAFLAAAERSR